MGKLYFYLLPYGNIHRQVRGVWRCGGAQSIGVRLTEQDLAAIRIQTKYRQHRARQHVAAVREQRAAVKIQAGYHGWVARKEVRRIRSE